MNTNMKLPENFTSLSEEEMMYTEGGSVTLLGVELANPVVAALAVGAAAVAVVVGFNIVRNVWNTISSTDPTSIINSSIESGQAFIDSSVAAGQAALDAMTPAM